MAIEIISYQRFQGLPEEPAYWRVKLRVNDLFNIIYPIPLDVEPSDFQTWLDERYPDVLAACKHIYGPKLKTAKSIAEIYILLQKIKGKVRL